MNELDQAAEIASRLFVNDNLSRADSIDRACRELDIVQCDDIWDEIEEKLSDILAGDR